jgi:hypothetical protein
MTNIRIRSTNLEEFSMKSLFEEKGFHNFTHAFYDQLFIDEKEVWRGAIANRIKTKPTIVLGTTNIGKTTFANNINNEIQKKYHHRGVCSIYTNEVSIGELIEHGLKAHKQFSDYWDSYPSVYVLVFDDATAVEVTPEELRAFFSIRHKAQEYAGITEGILYSIFMTHDWHSLNKLFRRYCETAVFLSIPPLDKFARSSIEGLIGEKAVSILDQISIKAIDYDEFKGYGFVKLPFPPQGETKSVGYIHFDNTESIYIKMKPWAKKTVKATLVDMVLHIPENFENSIVNRELEKARLAREKNNERQKRHRLKRMLKNCNVT